MVYIRGLETSMKWMIKAKTADDFIHKGFALFPVTIGCYKYWLESYYYYKLSPRYSDDSWSRIKFTNYDDCRKAVLDKIAEGELIK